MKPVPLTQPQLHLICATALVAMPTLKRYLRGKEPLRPAMVERIEAALKKLGLQRYRRAS